MEDLMIHLAFSYSDTV